MRRTETICDEPSENLARMNPSKNQRETGLQRSARMENGKNETRSGFQRFSILMLLRLYSIVYFLFSTQNSFARRVWLADCKMSMLRIQAGIDDDKDGFYDDSLPLKKY
jgi:hypothetical protein